MKKLSFMLVALAMIFTACDNKLEEYREDIQELSEEWQETTAMVTELAGQVQGEQAKAQTMLGQMNIPEGFTLSQENLQRAQELKGSVQEKLGSLSGIAQAIGAFVTNWKTEGNRMDALSSGLASGTVPTDVADQINSLKETLDGARNQVDDWKSDYKDATDGYTDAYEEFMELLPADNDSD